MASARAEVISAKEEAEKMMEEEGLSENAKRYIRTYVYRGLGRSMPPLDISKPVNPGDIGVPSYPSLISGTSNKVAVEQIMGADEMVVYGGKVWIKGVSTAGLIDSASFGEKPGVPSNVELKQVFVVEGTKVYTPTGGAKRTVPYLVAVDVSKALRVLDRKEVKRLITAQIGYEMSLKGK